MAYKMIHPHIPGRLQISTECNQDCLFCSISKGQNKKLSIDKLKKRIMELKKLGTTDLFITGGEPSIYDDIFKILDFAEYI